jgi:hypothetical protein
MRPIVVHLVAIAVVGASALRCTLSGEVRPIEGFLVHVMSPEVCGHPVTPEMGGPPDGDMGPEDNCGSVNFIESNGLVRKVSPRPRDLGILPPDVLNALRTAIETIDFDDLRSEPWEGTCPDGLSGWDAYTYDFFRTTGRERIGACGTEIDRDHPLFVALAVALRVVGQALP